MTMMMVMMIRVRGSVQIDAFQELWPEILKLKKMRIPRIGRRVDQSVLLLNIALSLTHCLYFKAILAWFGRIDPHQTNISVCRTTMRRRRRFSAPMMTNRRLPVITAREATILSRLAISSTTDTTLSGNWAGATSVLSGCAGT